MAILCTIRPHLEGLRFADTLRQFMPRCRIVMADFPRDADFLRLLISDFTYLALALNVEDLLESYRP